MSDTGPGGGETSRERLGPRADGAVRPAGAADERGGSRDVLAAVARCLLLALPLGVAWWLLAPTGRVVARPGYLLGVDDPELLAGQDVTFAALGIAAGVAVGTWVAVSPAPRPVHRAVGALVGSALGSLLCWQVGRLLGPDTVATGPDAVGGPAVAAPLDVHALGVLALWPATTALAGFLAFLVLSARHPQ